MSLLGHSQLSLKGDGVWGRFLRTGNVTPLFKESKEELVKNKIVSLASVPEN